MSYRTNSITACFGLPEPLNVFQLRTLLERMESLGCKQNGELAYNEGIWIEQELEWSLFGHQWSARIRQISFPSAHCSTVAFDVDSDIFLPGAQILYSPDADPKFLQYKNVLVQLVMELNPIIGEIDFEADLICSEIKNGLTGTIASWGNYFPIEWIHRLVPETKRELLSVVDESFYVEGRGLLTFIHPLKANRAWGSRHESLDTIVKRYID